MHWIISVLKGSPEIAIFLSMAIGYMLGKLKVLPGVTLGSTAGTLVAAVIVGQAGVEISGIVKAICFALFIFAVGYRTGPQFFASLNRSMLTQVFLAVVICVCGLIMVLISAKYLHLDKGMAAGLAAGGLTQSAIIGTAGDALTKLDGVTAEDVKKLQSNVAIGYAITYIFGTAGIVLFCKALGPKLLRVNLKEEARKLDAKLSGGRAALGASQFFAYTPRGIRAYRVERPELEGRSVSEIEAKIGERATIEAINHEGTRLKAEAGALVHQGDVLAVIAKRSTLTGLAEKLGTELDDPQTLDLVGEAVDVIVANTQVQGKSLGEIAEQHGRGVYLQKLTRLDHPLPVAAGTVIMRGDVMRLVGEKSDIARAIKAVGYADRPTEKTDLILAGLGIVAGTLLGLITVRMAGIPVTLGKGGGVLFAGLFCGWLRARHRWFGTIPPAADWFLRDFGLNAFIAVVGLLAGPQAVDAIKHNGAGVFVAGLFVTLVPAFIGLYFGKLVLKMNPVILLGAVAGGRSCNAAINGLTEDAESSTPTLGFTVPYAIANVLLTVWGPIVVALA